MDGARKTGVRANSHEVYPFLAEAVRRTVRKVICAAELLSCSPPNSHSSQVGALFTPAPIAPLRSLFSLSAELVNAQRVQDPDPSWLATAVPPHLAETVTASYACASCRRFVLPAESWFVPPFWERVHFLRPGIRIATTYKKKNRNQPGSLSRPLNSQARERAEGEEEAVEDLGVGDHRGGAGLATLEQRLLLALLTRDQSHCAEPHARTRHRRDVVRHSADEQGGSHRRQSDGAASLWMPDSSGSDRSESPSSASDDDDGDAHASFRGLRPSPRPTPAEPRESGIPTFVIGGLGPYGIGSRYCALCAASHLVLISRGAPLLPEASRIAEVERGHAAEVAGALAAWECRCEVCDEEKRVRRPDPPPHVAEEEPDDARKILRWLRRYP